MKLPLRVGHKGSVCIYVVDADGDVIAKIPAGTNAEEEAEALRDAHFLVEAANDHAVLLTACNSSPR